MLLRAKKFSHTACVSKEPFLLDSEIVQVNRTFFNIGVLVSPLRILHQSTPISLSSSGFRLVDLFTFPRHVPKSTYRANDTICSMADR